MGGVNMSIAWFGKLRTGQYQTGFLSVIDVTIRVA
jgi:hypothetical protein